MDEPRTFRTKKSVVGINVVVFVGWLALAIFLLARGEIMLGVTALVLLLLGVLQWRAEAYQCVTVDDAGIRYRIVLARERFLFWSHVTGARIRGSRLELLGEPRPIRVSLGAGFQDKDDFMRLLAKYLPHLVKIAPPPVVEELEAPTSLPLVGRPKLLYMLMLVFLVLPFGLVLLAMGGITGYGVFDSGSGDVWVFLMGLLMAIFFLATGGWSLLWFVHELPQKVVLDEHGVYLRSWLRGGYLAWSDVENVTLGGLGRDIRLQGAGKSLSFVFGWFPKPQRDRFARALQYYLVLHKVPFRRRDWLIP